MKTHEIIMLIFASIIALTALIVIFRNLKRKSNELGYFQELKMGPDGKTYIKYSLTALLSFLAALFWFMGNLLFLGEIIDNIGSEMLNYQFGLQFLIFNIIFALAAFAPGRLKEMDFNKLLSILKPPLK